jgi:hypothetical protein
MGSSTGYLRKCMDKRFGKATRDAFEKISGLGPLNYWLESYPGGAAVSTNSTGCSYAASHGATIFGWQAHGSGCGGQPGISDEEIQKRLDAEIAKRKAEFPGTHYRIYCTENGVEVNEVK